MVNGLNPDKAKLAVKWGRKAAGLFSKMAELPKDEFKVVRPFFLKGFSKKFVKWAFQKFPI